MRWNLMNHASVSAVIFVIKQFTSMLVALRMIPMENALLTHVDCGPYPKYEDDFFKGMTAALEVLKDIHRSRGEDVDGVKVFTKRVLAP